MDIIKKQMASNIIQKFADLTLDQMNSVLADLVVIRDKKLYNLRCNLFIRKYTLPPLPKNVIAYRDPTRGNLPLLCKIYNININEFQRSLTWIYLKNIIVYWYQKNIRRHVQLEYKDHKVMQKNHITNEYTYVSIPDYGFDINGNFAKFLITLSQVCKEWRVVLKSMCIWWGPAGGREFAFIKGSINHLALRKRKV